MTAAKIPTKKAVVLATINRDSRKNLDMRSGDTVKVHQKIQEKGKTRIQMFEGLVLARKHGAEAGATFTVRKMSGGYGVERIFPLYSPSIDKIEVTKRAKVRRAKLYYIRDKAAKEISKRMKMEMMSGNNTDVKEEEVDEAPIEVATSAEPKAE
ncbi:MAG: 50S ribosomal protein L19 [Patescibacteria group bacterium]